MRGGPTTHLEVVGNSREIWVQAPSSGMGAPIEGQNGVGAPTGKALMVGAPTAFGGSMGAPIHYCWVHPARFLGAPMAN